MPAEEFSANNRVEGDKAVIELAGDINREADPAMSVAYASVPEDVKTVLLNFTDVTYINSTGIAVIVALLARARTEGRTIVACGLSDHYREIFEITRLADFVAIFEDESSALASAPQP